MAVVALKGTTLKDVAETLNIKQSTLYRKMQNEGAFNRDEINKLIEFLDMSIGDVEDIFFAPELA